MINPKLEMSLEGMRSLLPLNPNPSTRDELERDEVIVTLLMICCFHPFVSSNFAVLNLTVNRSMLCRFGFEFDCENFDLAATGLRSCHP